MTAETWRPVPGWEGLYEVSDHGRVRSLKREMTDVTGRHYILPSRLRRLAIGTHGYPTVTLGRNGVQSTHLVHSLVALAFIGPRPADTQVAHWDGDGTNNSVANLRYATQSENEADKVRHGTCRSTYATCRHGHPFDDVNSYVNGHGVRICRACRRQRLREYRARQLVSNPSP